MDRETRTWKANLIQNIFDAESSKAILIIPISLSSKPDMLIWIQNPKGNYTVKSAFRTVTEQHLLAINSDVDWKKIRRIKAPERVKMLIWRIGANILPTNENLQRKIANLDDLCPLCHQEIESTVHLFLQCSIARALWFSCCWGFKPEDHSCSTSGDIMKLLTDPPQTPCPLDESWITTLNMSFVLDEIWRVRNQLVHHGGVIDTHAFIKLIHHKLAEYSLVRSANVPPPSSIVASLHKWNPPHLGWIKLNTDAAIGKHSNAIAVVARDHKGEVLKVWARSTPACSPLRAEASAILWAIQLAKVEKWPRIVIEGDAKNCFDPLSSSPTAPDWTISNTVSSILREFFLNCIFNWVKRECNSAAHATAKPSLSSSKSLCFNKISLPDVLRTICEVDCSAPASI